ncbi:copper resistance protein CopZ [Maritimibacter sp. 55A14]|nr:copper resistance protein CopZ [Maritimibacter sp. 55A14]
MARTLLAAAILMLAAACREETAEAPEPAAMTGDALGHFCMMQLTGHAGPKGQIHLEGVPDPIFFSQVRDALAYLRSAERSAPVLAVYVSDMGAAPSWEAPGPENWIAADAAHFVLGAQVRGGMGAPEIVPFGTAEGAEDFAARKGGRVVRLDEIPSEAVLAPVEIELPEG